MQVETTLNDRVTHGLRAQFNQGRIGAVLSQAETMFREAQFKGAGTDVPSPETYELFEDGWIDRALEFLGFGRWVIGRPKLSVSEPTKTRFARHVGRSTITIHQPTRSPSLLGNETASQSVVGFVQSHVPKRIADFQQPRGPSGDAIEYRSILVIGEQGSGKTTIARTLAYGLGQRFGNQNVLFALQVGGIDHLLSYGTRQPSNVWLLIGEDLTLSKIPKPTLAGFFMVRNLILQRTGLQRGLVVTVFNSHTLFGIERNLRTAFQMMILKSVPSNPYDRGLLKRYFALELIDWFEKHGRIEDTLVWYRFHLRGVAAKVPLPPENAIHNVRVGRSLWSRLFGLGVQ